MCGIVGAVAFTDNSLIALDKMAAAIQSLSRRGPDGHGLYRHERLVLGHTRLSIIDTSNAGNQPMTDMSGRYTIVLNGEFFNYQEHRQELISKGINFHSGSDTEVLLHLYMLEGPSCLLKVNGFFAVAIYDKKEDTLFIARDRMGVKPLLYYKDENSFLFASELKALMELGIPKELDTVALYQYLQLNYVPHTQSILKGVHKLEAGTYAILKAGSLATHNYYSIPKPGDSITTLDYNAQQQHLVSIMDNAVQRRLVSDVPLGAFLSGGIDSSVIVALASRHVSGLKTFSIGFKDEPRFDETHYAQLVADKYKTDHTVFKLSTDDMYANLHEMLDYMDEPFADSSALAVYILSKEVKNHVTVALSGDGADELFAGYNKHRAEWLLQQGGVKVQSLKALHPLLKHLPQSRNTKLGNKVRQLNRFAAAVTMPAAERYWSWASLASAQEARQLLKVPVDKDLYHQQYHHLLQNIHGVGTVDEVLYTDMHLVLQGDMLVKVDSMSMANSLEIRNPFLDYEVVDFAFSLPTESKIDAHLQKKIVKDAFKSLLPQELYHRNKQGFEVPLLKWFRTELKDLIEKDLLADDFIESQGIFNVGAIRQLKNQLNTVNPGDVQARIWALIVFQHWYKRIML